MSIPCIIVVLHLDITAHATGIVFLNIPYFVIMVFFLFLSTKFHIIFYLSFIYNCISRVSKDVSTIWHNNIQKYLERPQH